MERLCVGWERNSNWFDKAIFEELNQISEFHTAFGKVIYDNLQEYVQGIIADNIKN